MTLEEANKVLEGATVKFSSYYKYTFTFSCEHNGYEVSCGYGGDGPDNIYRYDVQADRALPVTPIEANWNTCRILKAGKEVFEFHDWS